MKQNKEPKVIKVSDEELSKLKEDLQKNNLSEPQKKILLAVLEAYYWLAKLYEAKKLNLKKLKRLFSFKTEKLPKETSSEEDDKKKKNEDNNKSGKGGPGRTGSGGRPSRRSDLTSFSKYLSSLCFRSLV